MKFFLSSVIGVGYLLFCFFIEGDIYYFVKLYAWYGLNFDFYADVNESLYSLAVFLSWHLKINDIKFWNHHCFVICLFLFLSMPCAFRISYYSDLFSTFLSPILFNIKMFVGFLPTFKTKKKQQQIIKSQGTRSKLSDKNTRTLSYCTEFSKL